MAQEGPETSGQGPESGVQGPESGVQGTETSVQGTESGGQGLETPVLPPALTEEAFSYIKVSGPWMSLTGIVGFVMCGIMLVAGIVMLFSSWNSSYYFVSRTVPGLLYIAIAVLYFFPSRLLVLAGRKISALKAGGGSGDLEAALGNIKAYWKFSGIILIVTVAALVLLLLVIVIRLLV
jgi:hypothetical protein